MARIGRQATDHRASVFTPSPTANQLPALRRQEQLAVGDGQAIPHRCGNGGLGEDFSIGQRDHFHSAVLVNGIGALVAADGEGMDVGVNLRGRFLSGPLGLFLARISHANSSRDAARPVLTRRTQVFAQGCVNTLPKGKSSATQSARAAASRSRRLHEKCGLGSRKRIDGPLGIFSDTIRAVRLANLAGFPRRLPAGDPFAVELLALIEVEVAGEKIRAAIERTDDMIRPKCGQRPTRCLSWKAILVPRAASP